MDGRKTLLALALGLALGGAALVLWPMWRLGGSARTGTHDSPLRSPQDMRLGIDEAGREHLRRLIREQARLVQPQDLGKLPGDAKVLIPLRRPGGAAPPGEPAALAGRIHLPAAGLDPAAPQLPAGYHPQVSVLAPGRLDWVFVSSLQSLDPEIARAPADYRSTDQSYELFVPEDYDPHRAYPLVLHVPAAETSDAWLHWGPVCRRHGAFLAGAHHAGNDGGVERPARMRTVLDVLDDVRRRFRIDPDRTYITGFSGGGNAAARIAFALPELFGGAAPVCGIWSLRREPWLRQRVAERLSVAVLTGEVDFNRPEMEVEFFPILREHAVRSVLRVYPRMGHAYPGDAQLEEVFLWLEEGLPQRQRRAQLWPASRLAGAVTDDEWAAALLLEAGERLRSAGGPAAGLFQIQGIAERWQGSPPADFARGLLREFDAHAAVPWKDIYAAENLRFAYLQARSYDRVFAPQPPPGLPVRAVFRVRVAIHLWGNVLELAPPGSEVAQEATARLNALQKQPGG
jgi:dienelactone hydrolase